MHHLSTLLLGAALAVLSTSAALKPDIRADTNRDGVVDINGTSDVDGKAACTGGRGAIFLPNIGDTTSRCHFVDRNGEPLGDRELASCSDGSSDILYAPEYLAPIRALPLRGVSGNATATVAVYPEKHARRVRLFLKGPEWEYVDREYQFNSSQIQAGLELGIDSRELVTDTDIWNGMVHVRFTVTDGNTTASDQVALKLAPVLLHHHLQSVETLVSSAATKLDPLQAGFNDGLEEVRKQTRIANPLLLLNGTSRGLWTPEAGFVDVLDFSDPAPQDFFEPAYSSMPGPKGPIAIRIMLRSPQSTRTAGRQVFEALRGKGVGGFQTENGFGWREINSFGNLETIPPYTGPNGTRYPAGRNILGRNHGLLPEPYLKFLRAQGLQDPLLLEMGWTVAGHVDELVSFIPYNNKRGWTIAIADVEAGLRVLRRAEAAGSGGVIACSKHMLTIMGTQCNSTITQFLANPEFIKSQDYARRYITGNLALLQSETGIPNNEIVRVPVLYQTVPVDSSDFANTIGGLVPRTSPNPPGERKLTSFYPSAINGVVIGQNFVTPKAWGPVINGTDVFQEAVFAAFRRVNMTVLVVDTIDKPIHIQGGDVHCGSNTIRAMSDLWWK